MRKHTVLSDDRRRGVLREHVATLHTGIVGEERGETGRTVRVEQAIGPSLGDRPELRHCDRQVVEGECKRLTVEVATRHDLSILSEDDGVVDHRPKLRGEHLRGIGNGVPDRTMDLGRTPQRVRILHLVGEVVVV